MGSYQGGVMRFGAKHNDIYPILGDMIRWKLDLPSRHTNLAHALNTKNRPGVAKPGLLCLSGLRSLPGLQPVPAIG